MGVGPLFPAERAPDWGPPAFSLRVTRRAGTFSSGASEHLKSSLSQFRGKLLLHRQGVQVGHRIQVRIELRHQPYTETPDDPGGFRPRLVVRETLFGGQSGHANVIARLAVATRIAKVHDVYAMMDLAGPVISNDWPGAPTGIPKHIPIYAVVRYADLEHSCDGLLLRLPVALGIADRKGNGRPRHGGGF